MKARLSFGILMGLALCCVVFLLTLLPRFTAPRIPALIAYASDGPSTACDDIGLCGDQITLLDPDTGTFKTIDFENAIISTESLFWSPDRQFLGFTMNGHLATYSLQNQIVKEFPSNNKDALGDWYISWIPHGLIRYEEVEDMDLGITGRLHVVPFNGVDTPYNHLGIPIEPSSRYGWVSATSDGSWLAIGSDDADIYVLDTSNGETTNITHDEIEDYQPQWSPDGRRLVWIAGLDEQPAAETRPNVRRVIAIYDRETQTIQKYPGDYHLWSVEWLTDESVLVFANVDENQSIFQRMDLNTGKTQDLTSVSYTWGNDLSPDRTQLAIIEIKNQGDGVTRPYICRFDLRSLEKTCYDNVPRPGASANPIWKGRR